MKGDVRIVCEVMEKELRDMRVEMAKTSIQQGVSKDIVLKLGIAEDEYVEAEEKLQQLA